MHFQRHYHHTVLEIDRACDQILASDPTVIALDTEGEVGPVAPRADVISLAVASDVYVLQLVYRDNVMISQKLAKLLANHNIIKVGVAIAGDVTRLAKIGYAPINNTLELQQLAVLKNLPIALDDLYHKLYPELPRLLAIDHSDSNGAKIFWTDDLSPQLLTYAARDAWATLLVLQRLLGIERNENYSIEHLAPTNNDFFQAAVTVDSVDSVRDIVPVTRIDAPAEQVDLMALAQWLQAILSSPRTERNLLAMIVNSYAPINCRGNKATVNEIAKQALQQLVQQNYLNYDAVTKQYQLALVAPEPELVPLPLELLGTKSDLINLSDVDIRAVTKLRFTSAVNCLSNSSVNFNRIADKINRQQQVIRALRQAIIAGRLELVGDYLYPSNKP